MKTSWTREDALPLTQKLAADLESAHETITKLDAEVGDGDLGVTCRLGMKAALDLLPTLGQSPFHEQLLKAGMSFNSAGASTFGALVASGAMRAAKYLREHHIETVDLVALAGALRAAAEGIQQRGKAARGDKTLLDSLWPAIEALEAGSRWPEPWRRQPPPPRRGPRQRGLFGPNSDAPPGCRTGLSASGTPGPA